MELSNKLWVLVSTVATLLLLVVHPASCDLTIEFTPDTVIDLTTEHVSVSCFLDSKDYDIKEIMNLYLTHTSLDNYVAMLSPNTGISYGTQLANYQVKAQGHVYEDVTGSYLNVTLNRPSKEVRGEYTCSLYYLDSIYMMNEKTVLGTLIWRDQTIGSLQDIIVSLKDQVALLEESLQSKETPTDSCKCQDQDVIEHRLSQLQQDMDKDGKDLLERISTLKKNILVERQGRRETFSADLCYFYNENGRKLRAIIPHTDAIGLMAQNYNKETGEFIAPMKGVYVFYVTISIGCPTNKGCFNEVYLMKNTEEKIASLFAWNLSTDPITESISFVVTLQAYETVTPGLQKLLVGHLGCNLLSHFHGFLIKKL